MMMLIPARQFSLALSLFLSPAYSSMAWAQPVQVDPDAAEEIVVNGIKNPYVLSAKQIADAAAAFDKWKSDLAPNGRLSFHVATVGAYRYEDLKLSFRSGNTMIPVSLDGNHSFSAPVLGPGKWFLVANRPRKSLVVAPIVMSPGTNDGNRLLGDLRLQCRVEWGYNRSRTSLVVRGLYSTAGGCESRKFGYFVTSRGRISDAQVKSATSSKRLKVLNTRTYRAPIAEQDLPDSARVVLTYL